MYASYGGSANKRFRYRILLNLNLLLLSPQARRKHDVFSNNDVTLTGIVIHKFTSHLLTWMTIG